MDAPPLSASRSAAGPIALWLRLLLYPGHTFPTAAAPVVVATGLALHDGVFQAAPVLLAFLCSWLIHTAGVLVDNYVLLSRHPDLGEHPELLAGLADGSLTLGQIRLAIGICLGLVALPAPYLIVHVGLPAAALGAIGLAASFGYSLTRFALTRTGWADVAFFVMFGVVAVAGSYYASAAFSAPPGFGWVFAPAAFAPLSLVVGLPVGSLIASILLIDDLRDIAFDRRKGWKTRPVTAGVRATEIEFAALVGFAYLAPALLILMAGFSAWTMLVWLTLPDAISIGRAVLGGNAEAMRPLSGRAARLSLDFAVLLAIGLAVRP
ncbi:MAG: UbiA family prenyltransferase [Bauldia sp.]